LLHGDLKPSNLLLGESYEILMIGDLGLTRDLTTPANWTVTEGRFTGTFASPEVMNGGIPTEAENAIAEGDAAIRDRDKRGPAVKSEST
jgi:serine/threonine protein kinase